MKKLLDVVDMIARNRGLIECVIEIMNEALRYAADPPNRQRQLPESRKRGSRRKSKLIDVSSKAIVSQLPQEHGKAKSRKSKSSDPAQKVVKNKPRKTRSSTVAVKAKRTIA